MLVTLAGIVMSGSTTVYYSAWAEERRMGLFGLAKATGRRLSRAELEPVSQDEIGRMHVWLRINRINVYFTYALGALVCLSTFVLGVAVLHKAEVELTSDNLVASLSRMMTDVVGGWARPVFYLGAWAAVISTAIGILDGGSRMYSQPLQRHVPSLYRKLSPASWRRLIMAAMALGCWIVYLIMPDVLQLIKWMGVIDAPLVGILMIAYAYLARWYVPSAYRKSGLWFGVMILVGACYLALGGYYLVGRFGQLL